MTATEKANAKLMRAAGFKKMYPSGDFDVWGRGDIRVMTGPMKMSVARLVGYVIEQAAYRMRRSASIQFAGFKTSNRVVPPDITRGDS